MKRVLSLFLTLLLAVSPTSCGTGGESEAVTSPPQTPNQTGASVASAENAAPDFVIPPEEFVLISGGAFQMDSPDSEAWRVEDETATDKSEIFPYHIAKGGIPIIYEAPGVMTCKVKDIYETDGFESFICKIAESYEEPPAETC